MKRILISILVAAVTVAGCVRNEYVAPKPVEHGEYATVLNSNVPEGYLLPYVSVKVNPDIAAELEAATDTSGYVDLRKVKSLSTEGVFRMRRLFPHGGEFEARRRACGSHLWYRVEYTGTKGITKSGASFDVSGVELIEYNPQLKIVGDPKLVAYANPKTVSAPAAANPFNDPLLSKQWHYYNDGTASSAVSGCDVNVFPVWKNTSYKKGDPNVIVSVVDQGVDFNHEDLAANMWENPEKKGNNRFGFNFAKHSYTINPGDHGTHVAGTIAAVNNNEKGVCGIAGGDSKKKVGGVKIMSCQIFDGQSQGSGAEAIMWGCDNGAVISQNSWGSLYPGTTSASLKHAVDYFTENAGFDKNGQQTGPMAGGIVIFAAGNDNSIEPYGSDYEKMYIVASVGADYRRAYYSNYGPWVHISAPGGDAKKGNQVLSTVTGNKYGLMQGTSMACPHVSGVAALILCNRAAKGFKSSDLRNLMNRSARNIESFNRGVGMGVGLINAYGAIAGSGGRPPQMPTDLSVTTQANNVTASFTIPSDPDDGTPSAVYVYFGKSNFTKPADADGFSMFYIGDEATAGSTYTGSFGGLDFETDYWFATQAVDLAGNTSSMTSRMTARTGANNPPSIASLDVVSVTIKPHETATMSFAITEPDGHYYKINLKPGSTGTTLDTLERDKPKIVLKGARAASAAYRDTLVVTEMYGLEDSIIVDYTILPNHAPYKGRTLDDMVFSSKVAPAVSLNATDYFKDDDGETLSYSIAIENVAVCNMNYSKGKFYVTPMSYGITGITVTGTDVRGEKVTQSFKVLVRDGSKPVDVYPNPVKDKLYLRSSEDTKYEVKIISPTGAVYYDKTVEISPFEPGSVDMKKAWPGMYTVILTKDGKEDKYSIVKL